MDTPQNDGLDKGLLSNMAIFGKFLGCSSVVIGILWEPFATSPRSTLDPVAGAATVVMYVGQQS